MAVLLSNSPADVLRRGLIALGYGADPPAVPWPVYVSNEPTSPDNVITLYDTAGRLGSREQVGQTRADDEGVAVRVRAASYTAGFVKVMAIADAFDRLFTRRTVTIGAVNYIVHRVLRSGTPVDLGKESGTSARRIFTLNCLVSLDLVV